MIFKGFYVHGWFPMKISILEIKNVIQLSKMLLGVGVNMKVVLIQLGKKRREGILTRVKTMPI